MYARKYSLRLGVISPEQFQAALDRFHLGKFLHAELIPFGLSQRNIRLVSTTGSYVFRGNPHYEHQFPTEHFFAQQLHEKTRVPVPWPYLFDLTSDIFGWSYAIMPLMPGLQLADPEVQQQLSHEDRCGIARAMGENLARMQQATWPFAGQYDPLTKTIRPFAVPYGSWVIEHIRDKLALSHSYNARTTLADIAWVEELITYAQHALNLPFEPCFVMQDYKENNAVAQYVEGVWNISGIFDFTHVHFGDGEADLAQSIALYLDKDRRLAHEFILGYKKHRPLRPGFAQRFLIYMLDNRLSAWEFLQKIGKVEWEERLTLREWVDHYVSSSTLSLFDTLPHLAEAMPTSPLTRQESLEQTSR
jgi:hygromycin-B 7''-O-kinase